jgi:hypothetical protein
VLCNSRYQTKGRRIREPETEAWLLTTAPDEEDDDDDGDGCGGCASVFFVLFVILILSFFLYWFGGI